MQPLFLLERLFCVQRRFVDFSAVVGAKYRIVNLNVGGRGFESCKMHDLFLSSYPFRKLFFMEEQHYWFFQKCQALQPAAKRTCINSNCAKKETVIVKLLRAFPRRQIISQLRLGYFLFSKSLVGKARWGVSKSRENTVVALL